ncbi:MAG: ABC transporter ATP-binding protein [Promethearchaeota archaeon]
MIQIKNLTKSYGRICVFDNLSLQVRTGSSTGIIAPNGAGKTTLFKILLGFTNIDHGEIHLFGELSHKDKVVYSSYLDNCRKRIGYVPEEAVFYEYLSPREYLQMLAILTRIPRAFQELRVNALLKLFKLGRWAEQMIATLSEGNRQRLSIAAAFVQGPELLILDEPLKSLDPGGRYHFQRLLSRFNQKGLPDLAIESRGTIFISSHLIADIERICSEVIILNHIGQIVAQGALTDVRNQLAEDASLEDVYLAVVEGFEDEEEWQLEEN